MKCVELNRCLGLCRWGRRRDLKDWVMLLMISVINVFRIGREGLFERGWVNLEMVFMKRFVR